MSSQSKQARSLSFSSIDRPETYLLPGDLNQEMVYNHKNNVLVRKIVNNDHIQLVFNPSFDGASLNPKTQVDFGQPTHHYSLDIEELFFRVFPF